MSDTFYCRIEALNLSDFRMNLIEDLADNMLHFCWNSHLLYHKDVALLRYYQIIRLIQNIFIN